MKGWNQISETTSQYDATASEIVWKCYIGMKYAAFASLLIQVIWPHEISDLINLQYELSER
jgi:hypothetical protein